MPYQRPLTPRQREAIESIHDHEGLIRGPASAKRYWLWRGTSTGAKTAVAGITVDSLVRLGLAETAGDEFGMEMCRLTPAGVQIQKQTP